MSEPKKINPWLVAGASALVLAAGFGVSVLARNSHAGAAAAPVTMTVLERVPKGAQQPARPAVPAVPTIPAGSPEDLARRYQIPVSVSQPSKGPEGAPVTIVMWCDFASQACRDADKPLQDVLKAHAEQVRLVYRHLPASESDADVGPQVFAQAAFRRANKFWEVRDRFLAMPANKPLGDAEFTAIAKELDIEKDIFGPNFERVGSYISTDLRFAQQFGVARPMGLFVNGRRVPAVAASELSAKLEGLITEELVSAKKLLKAGTPKAKLYQEIVKDGYWGIGDDPAARKAKELAAAAAGLPSPYGNPLKNKAPK